MGMPPFATESAAKCASSAEQTRMAGMIPSSLMRSQTSVFFMLESLNLFKKRCYRSTPVPWILYRVARICRWKMIVFAREPRIQGGQKKNADHEIGEESPNNHDGKRALRIRADSTRQRGGEQTEGRDQHCHTDRAKPENGTFR